MPVRGPQRSLAGGVCGRSLRALDATAARKSSVPGQLAGLGEHAPSPGSRRRTDRPGSPSSGRRVPLLLLVGPGDRVGATHALDQDRSRIPHEKHYSQESGVCILGSGLRWELGRVSTAVNADAQAGVIRAEAADVGAAWRRRRVVYADLRVREDDAMLLGQTARPQPQVVVELDDAGGVDAPELRIDVDALRLEARRILILAVLEVPACDALLLRQPVSVAGEVLIVARQLRVVPVVPQQGLGSAAELAHTVPVGGAMKSRRRQERRRIAGFAGVGSASM